MESFTRNTTGTYTTSIFFVVFLIVSTSIANELSKKNKEVSATVQEMQRANYFGLAMFINMVRDRKPSNATFLMPEEQMLSNATPEGGILSFISRQSAPSVLFFYGLKNLPTVTIIPTYQRDYKLQIFKGGRMRYYLNDVQIVGINICTSGFSFRCHGISGVLGSVIHEINQSVCCRYRPPAPAESSPAPSQTTRLPAPSVVGPINMVPTSSPPEGD